MFENALSAEAVQEALEILQHEFPLALWETVYVTLLSTAFAIVLGLPWASCWWQESLRAFCPFPNG